LITAKDYALVLGMPGTGKTTTIVEIIKSLAAKKKKILLTSYTHNAVDNVLLKLRGDVKMTRLGSVDKVGCLFLPK
jgi:DNA replication ATP-dependent helicase Dna2